MSIKDRKYCYIRIKNKVYPPIKDEKKRREPIIYSSISSAKRAAFELMKKGEQIRKSF